MLHDCNNAEEVTQETFAVAYENLDCLRDFSSFGAWVRTIARNRCYRIAKERRKQPISLDYLAELGIEPASSSDDSAISKEAASELRKIVQKLPGKYREIIDLRYAQDFSYKELSGFLGISLSAVKSRLFHAKKLILKQLKRRGLL